MAISIASRPFPHAFRERERPRAPPSVSDQEVIDGLYDDDEEDPPLESDWHVAAMALLVNVLRDFWTGRDDIYVSGNTVLRFDPAQRRKFRGPDLYVVKGVKDKGFRKSWACWKEDNLMPVPSSSRVGCVRPPGRNAPYPAPRMTKPYAPL
ncbi:MAG: hypothetical protein GY862_01715 [Gammaproteobacteria bacterium]|nr:hypothetical protein [Gammaproteobacteria bacterium]